MHISLFLCITVLSLGIVGCSVADDRTKRDLLDSEIGLFQEIKERVTKLEQSLKSRNCSGTPIQDSSPNTGTTIPGTTYVRWGRSSCGTNSSTLVYSGIVGCSVADDRTKRDLLDSEIGLFQEIKERVTKLEQSLKSRNCSGTPIQDSSPNTGTTIPGTTYVRWGRSSCGTNSSTLVYSGIVGGSHFTHSGGAAEYVCLPKNPEWGLSLKGWQQGGRMYGAEYRFYDNSFVHQSHSVYEVPCAVCDVTGRTRKIMIAGRKSCNSDWTKEYNGYLMSGDYGHTAATQYICVDKNAKKIGSETNHVGKLLYMVESVCNPLPCPPYANEKELTCVVCTK